MGIFMDLGKSLRVAMVQAGVKNSDVSDKFRVSSQQVTNWRGGSISKDNMIALANYFDLRVSEFIALGEE